MLSQHMLLQTLISAMLWVTDAQSGWLAWWLIGNGSASISFLQILTSPAYVGCRSAFPGTTAPEEQFSSAAQRTLCSTSSAKMSPFTHVHLPMILKKITDAETMYGPFRQMPAFPGINLPVSIVATHQPRNLLTCLHVGVAQHISEIL
jgi:hypothetical protein